jgi:hypothetical protein
MGGELTSRRLEAWDGRYLVTNHADARSVRAGRSRRLELDCRRVVVVVRLMVMGRGGSGGGGSPRHG